MIWWVFWRGFAPARHLSVSRPLFRAKLFPENPTLLLIGYECDKRHHQIATVFFSLALIASALPCGGMEGQESVCM